jgi:hypothetical protein
MQSCGWLAGGARAEAVGRLCARHGELVGVAGVLREQALALGRLIEDIAEECQDGSACVGRSPEHRHAERVGRLLDGGTGELSGFDYELDVWHLGAIAVGERAGEAVGKLAAGIGRRLLCVSQGERCVWAWFGGRERLASVDVERAIVGIDGIGSHLPAGVVFAVGEPARGLEGWRLTHRQAQAAFVVALRHPRICTRYADVALLAAALKDEALAQALSDIYLLPLDDAHSRGQVLRRTLRAYLAAERSVSSAAAALGVARKTVESRLRTIEERLGRTLHPCPAELEVALLLDELPVGSDR